MHARLLVVTALGAASAFLTVSPPAAGQEPASSLRLSGVVLDRSTDRPVAGADVLLSAPGRPGPPPRVTDDRGRFEFPLLAPGVYRIGVRRLGFRPLADSLVLLPGTDVRLSVALVATAVELEPVVVTASRSLSRGMSGFHERRRNGMGTFIAREEIEARNPSYVSDLFRTVPGVRVVASAAPGSYDVRMHANCRPAVYVDGALTVGGYGVDSSLSPFDVEAVEVYGAAEAPAQYGRHSCGTILFWTRTPEVRTARGSGWRRLVVVGAFALSALLLTR